MARTRQRKSNSSASKSHKATNPRTTLEQKLRSLSKRGIHADPTNPRSVSQRYRAALKRERIPKELERPASKPQRDELRAHGFRTTKRGVIVDGPRNKRREPIKGARIAVAKGGVIKMSVGQRRDFIYGFTKKEKKEFARDPGAFEKKKLKELRSLFPLLRKARKPQVRLQWGAYQATKAFAPSYFTAKYFASISPEEIRKVGKRHAKPRTDKLTGFHIVVHVQKPKAKRAKGKKK